MEREQQFTIRAECPVGKPLCGKRKTGTHGPTRLTCPAGGELCNVWCEVFPGSSEQTGVRGVLFGHCAFDNNFYGGYFTELHEQPLSPGPIDPDVPF